MRPLAPLALAAAGLLAPRPAHACTCTSNEIEVLPRDGATDVPRNTRIWIGSLKHYAPDDAPPEPTLTGPSGPVQAAQTKIDTSTWSFEEEGTYTHNDLWVVTPLEPLSPGPYTVTLGGALTRFTVGDAPDLEPPPVPRVTDIDATVGRGPCGDKSNLATLTLEPEHDLLSEFIVVEREDHGALDPSALTGRLADAVVGRYVDFGAAPCVYNWAEAEPGASTRIRLGAFDLAGNFSGWTEWIDLELPVGCTCTAAADDPRRPLSLLLLAVLLLARRRARR